MLINTAENTSRKRVFISYSREPKENADFVRNLAGLLRVAKFDVWLDEERLSGGTKLKEAIKEAINQSDVGLFIVTKGTDRDWTQFEIDLFAARPETRRVAVVRDELKPSSLGPHLAQAAAISYPYDDPQPHARFWEIYCGITDCPPGPRAEWEMRGREILQGDSQPIALPQTQSPEKTKHDRIPLPCRTKPVLYWIGNEWIYLSTDNNEWVGFTAEGKLHSPIPRLVESACAAISISGRLMVGMYESMVAWLDEERWQFLPVEAPVLCFAGTVEGELIGTAAGSIALIDSEDARPVFRMRDPVVAMAGFQGGLLAIGSRGMFGRLQIPIKEDAEFKWIETRDIGRPVGFFQAAEQDCIGVHSSDRIGIFSALTNRILPCPQRFESRIRQVVFMGAQRWPYALLTDSGELVLVDANLRSTRLVALPHGESIRGCFAAPWAETTLVWTNAGTLYKVKPGTTPLRGADENVVLAYSPVPEQLHIVRWNESDGATLELGSF